MKTLLIMRHAKTQPDAPHSDHARKLTVRGVRDAKAMAGHIRAEIGVPDAIVTSDAKRARQTAEILAIELGFVAPLRVEPRIYDAGLGTLLEVVRRLPEKAERVVLVGHNPSFEALAEALSGDTVEVHLPTSALAHVELDVPRWSDAKQGTGRLRGVSTRRTIR